MLEALSWSTTLTRAALAEQLGAPKATLAGLVDSLIAAGLVVEGEAPVDLRRPGRPAKVLMLAGPRPLVGALVFSGGMLTAAVLTYAGDVLSRASVPVGAWAHDEVVTGPGPGLLEDALQGRGGEKPTEAGSGGYPGSRRPPGGVPAPLGAGSASPAAGPGADGPGYVPWPSSELAVTMERLVGGNDAG